MKNPNKLICFFKKAKDEVVNFNMGKRKAQSFIGRGHWVKCNCTKQ